MRPIPVRLKLGPVTLSIVVADADKNGAVDVTVGLKVDGLGGWSFPPYNLDAKAAEQARRAAEKLAKRLGSQK